MSRVISANWQLLLMTFGLCNVWNFSQQSSGISERRLQRKIIRNSDTIMTQLFIITLSDEQTQIATKLDHRNRVY